MRVLVIWGIGEKGVISACRAWGPECASMNRER